MTIKIRRGSADDAPFLASILLSSSRAHLPRGIWDLIIGKDDKGCLEYLTRLVVTEPKSLYHYESFQVAEIEGTQAAALGGFPLDASRWSRVSEVLSQVQQGLGLDRSGSGSLATTDGPCLVLLPRRCGCGLGYRKRGSTASVSRTGSS